jgi:CMP-N-acetylneuraminate monooxygenase
LPGERFDGSSAEIERRPDRDQYLDRAFELEYVSRVFDEDEFKRHQPEDAPVTYDEIADYLLSLNKTTEIVFSDELVATLRVTDLAYELAGPEVGFRIVGERLDLLAEIDPEPNLLIEIPQDVLARVIRDRLPWDEADIGYWIRFDRAPDVFHAGFWRLIHSPYYEREAGPAPAHHDAVEPTSVIGEILERHGAPADRILRRYGLYCSGCRHSTAETIELGAAQHGLTNTSLDRMVRELQEQANGRGLA